jgi:REP element-mobilizing transposase RayT
MFRISKDSPVHYITSVTHNRLPVFRTTKLKEVMCEALNEARTSASLLIFAYVIMPDHVHALMDLTENLPTFCDILMVSQATA